MNNFNFGELFCGPGGLALGAGLTGNTVYNGKKYNVSHIWGVDKDPAAIETYRGNIVRRYGGNGICMDAAEFCDQMIHTFPAVDALAFGFPCNDFSLVGKQNGLQGKYGNLYKAGISAIEKSNPFWFVAENVSGIYSADSGNTFKTILHELENSGRYGYQLTAHLFKFEEYGIPQYRHRYIIVGIRKDMNLKFKVPAPSHGAGLLPYLSAGNALNGIDIKNVSNTEMTRQHPVIVQRLKLTPPGENAWFLDKLIKMTTQERKGILIQLPWYKEVFEGLSDDSIVNMIELSRLKCTKARMSHIYKRLTESKPSYTITGSGGGGTHVYHWCEHRSLSNRERARLQGFPDWFKFEGTKEQVRKQIGMAVPPKGAKIIFKAIFKTFAGKHYKTVPASFEQSEDGDLGPQP